MRIALLGLPGAGKGTQGELLAKKYNLKKITVGDIYRKIAEEDTEFGRKIREILDRGEIVPDDITNELVKERIEKLDGWILDGYPRTLYQAKFLEENFQNYIVVYIDVDVEEIVKRLSARRICPKCGAVYNMITKPPKNDETCDVCGTKLVIRDDDKPEVVRKRIEVQKKNIDQMIEYYKNNEKLIVVNGNKSIREVFEEIVKKIGEYCERKNICDDKA